MSFIRPQARAAIWRWREVLAASGVLALGAYWTFGLNGGVLHWLGFVVLGIGAIAMVSGLQRVRFREHRGGVGVVSIDEGQVSYFGPLSGGVIAMREMTKLTLDPTMEPPHWCLTQIGEQTLYIPVDAEGADALFDAFSMLPGIKTESMLATMRGGAFHPVVIWQKKVLRLH
jgi:hypothetical protein